MRIQRTSLLQIPVIMDEIEDEYVHGVIRRRREFSKKLSFFALELEGDDALGHPIQLVCDGWTSPRAAVNGETVQAFGTWDVNTPVTNGFRRFLVHKDRLIILNSAADPTLTARGMASEHAAWRARIGATCTCTNILCASSHGDPRRWQERRQLLLKRREEKKIDIRNPDKDAHSCTCASKAKHNAVFTSWLVNTFPRSVLDKGVVDIAGGRGLISLELALEHNIQPVTLIEPKPLKLNSTYRRRIKRWRKKQIINEGEDLNEEFAIDMLPLGGCIGQYEEEFHGLDTCSSEELRESIERCGVIIAMHPDGATGAALETALMLNKPFAIVPCCVFSHQFPERLTPGGKVVTTYDDFLDYLQSRADPSQIQRSLLPFEGRNTVLYSTTGIF